MFYIVTQFFGDLKPILDLAIPRTGSVYKYTIYTTKQL